MEETDSDITTKGASYGSGGGYRGGGYGGGYGGRGRGGGFGGPRPFRPAPVKVGDEYDVKIESMSKRGDAGVAKVEGLVIFVSGTKVGDSVRIKITKVGRGYATAEMTAQSSSEGGGARLETSSSSEGLETSSSSEGLETSEKT
ncbi:MAG TPA: TRAM domain-containing protein [Nitrososphaeraceae archaeon]|nr:TRAM domain-containing protein [Nitrososphaeraceae archaeon]